MIENNLPTRRQRSHVVPSTSLRGHFVALARTVRQWSDSHVPHNDGHGPLIGVTSLDHGSGSSTVSFNLACALASLSHTKTIFVEADFGRHFITQRLGHHRAMGLAELLLGVAEPAEIMFPTPIPDVHVIGCGGKSETESLELPFEVLKPMVDEGFSDCGYYVFDLPVATELTAFYSIAPQLDGVILVVDSANVEQRRITRFKRQMELGGSQVVGIVLNKS